METDEYEITKPSWEVMKYLGDENLLEIINKEFNKFIAGEENTREAIFICNCSNWVENLDSHFNVFVNGNSSAGKSWTTRKVLEIFPPTIFSRETYRTRISQKALTYWHNSRVEPEWTWDGKTLYLEDIGNDILNCDVFKVMTSEGSLATIVTKKKVGGIEMPVTTDIEIIGKPTIVITTAVGTPIEEIKNRFLMIDLDESQEQTERIMEMQVGVALTKEKSQYNPNLREALKHLKRVKVLLPEWVKAIPLILPRKNIIRWRREFPRFLDIIKCSCALHQYQREKEGEFYKSNTQDYNIARRVIGKISASSGIEGLNHRERVAYESIKEYFKSNNRGCTRAEIYAFNPIYTDRYWASLLEKLAGKGLLSVKLELNEDTKRKASFYYPIEFQNLELPTEEELMELTAKELLKASQGISTETALRENHPVSSITTTTLQFDESLFSKEEIEKSGIDPELIKKTMKEIEDENKPEIVSKIKKEEPRDDKKDFYNKLNSFGF